MEYVVNDKDRIAAKYFYQNDPTTNPFSVNGVSLGFPMTLTSGSQVLSLTNSAILAPNLLWQQQAGFTRMRAFSKGDQDFQPSAFGINLVATTQFPDIVISTADPTLGEGLHFGSNDEFSNAGVFQNEWCYGTNVNVSIGRHTLESGFSWNYAQLNIEDDATASDLIQFKNFETFVEGAVRPGNYSRATAGQATRYYRANTAGAYTSHRNSDETFDRRG
jgi:hypothetical protein